MFQSSTIESISSPTGTKHPEVSEERRKIPSPHGRFQFHRSYHFGRRLGAVIPIFSDCDLLKLRVHYGQPHPPHQHTATRNCSPITLLFPNNSADSVTDLALIWHGITAVWSKNHTHTCHKSLLHHTHSSLLLRKVKAPPRHKANDYLRTPDVTWTRSRTGLFYNHLLLVSWFYIPVMKATWIDESTTKGDFYLCMESMVWGHRAERLSVETSHECAMSVCLNWPCTLNRNTLAHDGNDSTAWLWRIELWVSFTEPGAQWVCLITAHSWIRWWIAVDEEQAFKRSCQTMLASPPNGNVIDNDLKRIFALVCLRSRFFFRQVSFNTAARCLSRRGISSLHPRRSACD